MKKKKKFFRQKKITAVISLIAVIAGFIFLDRSITGSVISQGSSFNLLSLIGLLLVLCALVLGTYSIKRK